MEGAPWEGILPGSVFMYGGAPKCILGSFGLKGPEQFRPPFTLPSYLDCLRKKNPFAYFLVWPSPSKRV